MHVLFGMAEWRFCEAQDLAKVVVWVELIACWRVVRWCGYTA